MKTLTPYNEGTAQITTIAEAADVAYREDVEQARAESKTQAQEDEKRARHAATVYVRRVLGVELDTCDNLVYEDGRVRFDRDGLSFLHRIHREGYRIDDELYVAVRCPRDPEEGDVTTDHLPVLILFYGLAQLGRILHEGASEGLQCSRCTERAEQLRERAEPNSRTVRPQDAQSRFVTALEDLIEDVVNRVRYG